MSGNRLLIASSVLVLLLGVTFFQFRAREREYERPAELEAKLPKVDKDQVDALEIVVPGKPKVALGKREGAWTLVEPIAAEADTSAVDTALAKLAELEATGIAATQQENHAKLEVDEAQAVHVVAKQGEKVLADLWLGAYRNGNTMVREQGSTQVVSAKGSIKYAFDKELKEWRNRVITGVPSEKISAIGFQNGSGSLRFVKEGDEWKQAPGERPIVGFDPTQVTSVVSMVSTLRAIDFAPADVDAQSAQVGATPAGLLTLTVAGEGDARDIVLRIGREHEGNYYVAAEGKEPIYMVSSFTAERLLSGANKFQKEEAVAAASSDGNASGKAKKAAKSTKN